MVVYIDTTEYPWCSFFYIFTFEQNQDPLSAAICGFLIRFPGFGPGTGIEG